MSNPVGDAAVPVIPVIGARPAAVAGGGSSLDPGAEAVPGEGVGESTFEMLLRGLNPLHHLPVVGMIYRAVTGETVPGAERIAVSAVTSAFIGGPLGILGTVVGMAAEEIWKMAMDPNSLHYIDPASGARNQAAVAASAGDTGAHGSG
jgi:hypothetical protein